MLEYWDVRIVGTLETNFNGRNISEVPMTTAQAKKCIRVLNPSLMLFVLEEKHVVLEVYHTQHTFKRMLCWG